MAIRAFISVLLACIGALAQNCRPGSVTMDVDIRCACVKDPNSQTCDLYKRNKSMYDGKGVQMWNPPAGLAPAAPTRSESHASENTRSAPQERTPVSATLLPAETPFWRILPPGTRMAVGMRPQWMVTSPLLDQMMRMAGPVGGQSMDAMRSELAAVDTVIIAMTSTNAPPLILARAEDVVRATKSERDPYRYVDPDTILVGDWKETGTAMNRLFSKSDATAEARMAGRVAAWSDFWVVMNLLTAPGGLAARLPGATRLTVGASVRDDITVEAWLDTASPLAAKRLADRLRSNPKGAPIVDQIAGAQTAIEERGSSVRLYARLAGVAGHAATAASRPPALAPVSRAKVSEVHPGMLRTEVEALLGRAHSETTIQGAELPVATLIYHLDDKGIAQVRTVDGKVESIQFFQ